MGAKIPLYVTFVLSREKGRFWL